MTAAHIYHGCGITFESELELPGIPRSDGTPPSATIRPGTIPSAQQHSLTAHDWYHAAPGQLQFLIPGIGRYQVTNGTDVLIEPASGASASDLRLFLMGSAFGGLLHQRGVLPLHASTVRVGDGYVGFVGHSGDGKSTQSAILHHAGYPLAGDDICPVAVTEDGSVLADSGFPRLKLCSDALDALNICRDGLERACIERDKYSLSTREQSGPEQRPLRALYRLEYATDDSGVGIEQLTGQRCLPELLQHTYRYCFVSGLGCTAHHFQLCSQLAATVPVFTFRRRRGAEYFAENVERLEQHWHQLMLQPAREPALAVA